MARFITSIELFEAEEADYTNLLVELKKNDFRVIEPIFNKRTSFKAEGDINIQQVTASVSKAARNTGKRFSFTIIKDKPFTDKEYLK